MTRKALIKEAELHRMAKVAKKFGVVVEQEFKGIIIRVSPFDGGIPETNAATALDQWRSSKPKQAKDPIKDWYDSLGYDPKTMDESDLKRLMEESEEQWLASIPNRPMLKSEKSVLRQLSEYGVGVCVPWKQIKSCGPGTENRLKVRGYIEVHMQADFPDRLDSYSLTSDGHAAALQLES